MPQIQLGSLQRSPDHSWGKGMDEGQTTGIGKGRVRNLEKLDLHNVLYGSTLLDDFMLGYSAQCASC